jgi:serine/threonine protein kinase
MEKNAICGASELSPLNYYLAKFHSIKNKPKKLYRDIMNMKIDLDEGDWDSRSREAKDFIEKLLQPNPKMRILPSEALNHKWIRLQDELEYDDLSIDILDRVLNFQMSNRLSHRKGSLVPKDDKHVLLVLIF